MIFVIFPKPDPSSETSQLSMRVEQAMGSIMSTREFFRHVMTRQVLEELVSFNKGG